MVLATKFIVCLFFILLFNISCDVLPGNQGLDTRIIGFIAPRQPPDISQVDFTIHLSGNKNTLKGTTYVIALQVNGQTVDSDNIQVLQNGYIPPTISMRATGSTMNKMLLDLDAKYEEARSKYQEFGDRTSWNIVSSGNLPDYDEFKRLEKQNQELKAEADKWAALRVGNGQYWWEALNDFCGKYVTFSISNTASSSTKPIQVLSGTGNFSDISSETLSIVVSPNQKLNGIIKLDVNNDIPAGAIAPLIGTPSWGEHSNSWWLINKWLPTGHSTQSANINNVQAPDSPGNYYLIFAFAGERTGDQVASATNWTVAQPVWNDGNDIADFSSKQISQAHKDGTTINAWTTNESNKLVSVAACAIKIVVGSK